MMATNSWISSSKIRIRRPAPRSQTDLVPIASTSGRSNSPKRVRKTSRSALRVAFTEPSVVISSSERDGKSTSEYTFDDLINVVTTSGTVDPTEFTYAETNEIALLDKAFRKASKAPSYQQTSSQYAHARVELSSEQRKAYFARTVDKARRNNQQSLKPLEEASPARTSSVSAPQSAAERFRLLSSKHDFAPRQVTNRDKPNTNSSASLKVHDLPDNSSVQEEPSLSEENGQNTELSSTRSIPAERLQNIGHKPHRASKRLSEVKSKSLKTVVRLSSLEGHSSQSTNLLDHPVDTTRTNRGSSLGTRAAPSQSSPKSETVIEKSSFSERKNSNDGASTSLGAKRLRVRSRKPKAVPLKKKISKVTITTVEAVKQRKKAKRIELLESVSIPTADSTLAEELLWLTHMSLKSQVVLTPEEDKCLGRILFRVRPQGKTKKGKKGKASAKTKSIEIPVEWKQHAKLAGDILVKGTMPLVRKLADQTFRVSGWGVKLTREDLEQEGCVVLNNALQNYNPTKGARFGTFAYVAVRGAMNRAIRNHATVIRVPIHIYELESKIATAVSELLEEGVEDPSNHEIARKIGVHVSRVAEMRTDGLLQKRDPGSLSVVSKPLLGEEMETLEETLHGEERDDEVFRFLGRTAHEGLMQSFEDAMATLLPREQEALKLRHGVTNGGEGMGLREAASVMGVSKDTVRRNEQSAVRKLQALDTTNLLFLLDASMEYGNFQDLYDN